MFTSFKALQFGVALPQTALEDVDKGRERLSLEKKVGLHVFDSLGEHCRAPALHYLV